MTYVPNPFRIRLAEQQRDTGQFLRTFGAGMLDALPDASIAWDRLVVLRSAPGAGKTSLLRMLTPQMLVGVCAPRADFAHIKTPLERIGAVRLSRPALLGVMVSLGKDYRALIDLGPGGRGSDIVFFRLLDARIVLRFVEAVLELNGLRFPGDAARITLKPREGVHGQDGFGALSSFMGPLSEGLAIEDGAMLETSGDALLSAAYAHERDVLRLLDSLLPVDWSSAHGHSRLYSLQILSGLEIQVDSKPSRVRPVVLFDDVHDLGQAQRQALYEQLMDRSLDLGRWVAERYVALRDDELLTDASPDGRDVSIIRLEHAISKGTRRGQVRTLFGEIANSRARSPLLLAGNDTDEFTSLLQGRDDVNSIASTQVLDEVRKTVQALVLAHAKYQPWLRDVDEGTSQTDEAIRSATRWRELQLLIERDRLKPAQTLFEDEFPDRSYADLSGSSTRAAARLFLSRDYGLPYYAGPNVLSELGSTNVEQYLGLAGDLFDLMLASLVLKRRPSLTAQDQDRRARLASRRLWEAVPQRVAHGNDVVALLHAIAANSRWETYRPNAPYAPGVTGTAFAYFDRKSLTAGTTYRRLSQALASAIAHNLLEVDEPNKTKNGMWTVLYLNRLLCPYFGLPLQRGGFREQTIGRLADWLDRAAAVTSGGAPDPEAPLPGVDRVAS